MFNTRLWIFLHNVYIAKSCGRKVVWKEMWQLTKARVKLSRLTFEMEHVNKQIPPIIRQVIDEVKLTPITSGTLGLGYQLMLGRKSDNPNTDAACIRIFAEIRYFNVRQDALAMLLLEGHITVSTYVALCAKFRGADDEFKSALIQKHPALLKGIPTGPFLNEAAKRIIAGETREIVLYDYLGRIWPSLKNKASQMEA